MRKKYFDINIGRFPFDEKFGLEFPEISRKEWNRIFRISEKGDNIKSYNEIFEISNQGLPFHLLFLPKFPKFSVE